jgi:hypothetical protein
VTYLIFSKRKRLSIVVNFLFADEFTSSAFFLLLFAGRDALPEFCRAAEPQNKPALHTVVQGRR